VTPPWLLNDENSAPSLAQRLSDLYAGSAHVRDVGLTTADDEQIRLHARDGGYLIVTKDDDFRQRSFLRGAPPKVLWAKLAIAPPPMLNEHCAVGMQRLLPSRKLRWLRSRFFSFARSSAGALAPPPKSGVDSSIATSLCDTHIHEVPMSVVTVSPKFQVVIPREIREALRLEPRQKVHVLQYQNRIEFIPVQAMQKMRGFLKGIDTTVPRERDRV